MSKPNLEQLKKQAKELVRAHAAKAPEALAFIRAHGPRWAGRSDEEIAAGRFRLHDAQWTIARSLGDSSWPELVHRLGEAKRSAVRLPLVPVRGVVVFPGQRITLHVGRARSIRAMTVAVEGDGMIVMVAQRAARTEEPALADLHPIGTLGRVLGSRRAAAGDGEGWTVDVEGRRRARLEGIDEEDGMLVGRVALLDEADAVADPDSARRAAVVALEAVARRLEADVPGLPGAMSLLMPYMHHLPAAVQQQILESEDVASWVRALSSALKEMELR